MNNAAKTGTSKNDAPVAILVVHGIGQQSHYECSAALAGNLARQAGADIRLRPARLGSSSDSSTDSEDPDFILQLVPRAETSSRREYHVYECWWGPLARPSPCALEVIGWLLESIVPNRAGLRAVSGFKRKTVFDMIQILFAAAVAGGIPGSLATGTAMAFNSSLSGGNGWENPWQALALAVSSPIALLGTARFVSRYLGDVKLFLARDPYRPDFEVRRRIIRKVERDIGQFLERLERDGYSRAIIVAHSLGAIATLDALSNLIARHRARKDFSRLETIRASLTLLMLGAPLAKVPYLDRFRDPLEHWRNHPGRDGVASCLAETIHACYRNDPVADCPPRQDTRYHVLGAGIPLWCHTGYWRDPQTARLMMDLVDLPPRPGVLPR